MPSDLIVAGHVCLDIAPAFNQDQTFDQIFCPGRLSMVGAASISTGGAVANTGLAAHKLGLNTVLMGKVGADAIGLVIQDLLAKSGARLKMSVSANIASSYSIVINLSGIDRIFLHHPGANDHFDDSDLHDAEIADTQIFHFGYPPLMKSLYQNNGAGLVKIMAKAKQLGATTSLDMAMPDPSTESGQVDWETVLKKAGPYVDIFLPSYEELFLMLDKAEYLKWRNSGSFQDLSELADFEKVKGFARRLQEFGMGIVVIKAGKNGIYLLTPKAERLRRFKQKLSDTWADQKWWVESYQPKLFVSSTGAGDCAIAGFLSAFLRGYDPAAALKVAALAGYHNLRATDAVSGLGSWAEINADLQNETLAHNELDLSKYGFYKAEKGLWIGD